MQFYGRPTKRAKIRTTQRGDHYVAGLADLAKVNRITFAYRPTLAFLGRAVGDRKKFRLLEDLLDVRVDVEIDRAEGLRLVA